MRKDKTGNKRVIAETGFYGAHEAISRGLHNTTMGFTAGKDNPLMRCVILTSESQRKFKAVGLLGSTLQKLNMRKK